VSEARFSVRLLPRGGSDRVEGVDGEGMLRARVAAPPVGGAANAALVELLATELGLPKSAVRIVRGDTSRLKSVVAATTVGALTVRWPGLHATVVDAPRRRGG
jgi:uncharacterized protein YggU (UPF0235/DUF167 family)